MIRRLRRTEKRLSQLPSIENSNLLIVSFVVAGGVDGA